MILKSMLTAARFWNGVKSGNKQKNRNRQAENMIDVSRCVKTCRLFLDEYSELWYNFLSAGIK